MNTPCRWVSKVSACHLLLWIWKIGSGNRKLHFNVIGLQHFGFQPEELADEFSQSTIELLGSVLRAMQSKVGQCVFFVSQVCVLLLCICIYVFVDLFSYICFCVAWQYDIFCLSCSVVLQLLEKQPNLEKEDVERSFNKLEEIYTEKV